MKKTADSQWKSDTILKFYWLTSQVYSFWIYKGTFLSIIIYIYIYKFTSGRTRLDRKMTTVNGMLVTLVSVLPWTWLLSPVATKSMALW